MARLDGRRIHVACTATVTVTVPAGVKINNGEGFAPGPLGPSVLWSSRKPTWCRGRLRPPSTLYSSKYYN